MRVPTAEELRRLHDVTSDKSLFCKKTSTESQSVGQPVPQDQCESPVHHNDPTTRTLQNPTTPTKSHQIADRVFNIGTCFAYGCAFKKLVILFATVHARDAALALVKQIEQYFRTESKELPHDEFVFWMLHTNCDYLVEKFPTLDFKKLNHQESVNRESSSAINQSNQSGGETKPSAQPEIKSAKENIGNDEKSSEGKIDDNQDESDFDSDDDDDEEPQSLFLDATEAAEDGANTSIKEGQAYFIVHRKHLKESCRSLPGPGTSGMPLFRARTEANASNDRPIGLLVGCAVHNSNLLIFAAGARCSFRFFALTQKIHARSALVGTSLSITSFTATRSNCGKDPLPETRWSTNST